MPLQPGTTLGPYEILSPIGAGGMGEVYKARDTRLDRTVAIKVLPEHVASDPDLKPRFEREAKTISSLNHPHICTLHDIGSQDGIDFLVMEYLEGDTLAQRLEKGALPLGQALKIAVEIADALDKAHRQGITHRNLKPGNIMLTKAGAKLLDSGLAKLKSGHDALVYEMATGQKAFRGESQASLIGAILKDEPPPVSTLQSLTPVALDYVVKTCLAKNPDKRWQSASLTIIQGIVIVAMAVLAGSGFVRAQNAPPGWHQIGGPNRNFHVESPPLAESWPEDGPRRLWSRPLGEGYSSVVTDGDVLVTMYRDGDTEVVVGLDPGTGATRWEHVYEARLAHNGYVDIWLNASGPGPYSTPLLRGGTVFAVGIDGRLHALDAATGALRWSQDLVDLFDLTTYNAFASSPLAFGDTVILPLGGSGEGVVAFERDTGAVVWHSDRFAVAPGSPVQIEVDGQTQMVVVGQQELVGLDPEDGRMLWRHPHTNELGLNLSMPVWGPDGLLFMSSAYDGGTRVIRLSQIDGRTTADEVWATNRMRVHFSNALRIGELVIGSSGDFGPAFLIAMDVATGEEVWRERRFARAHMVYADGKLVIIDEDGDLAIASVGDQGLEVHAQAPILTENAWTPPTLVGTTLYVRDRRNILAFDLGR